MRNLALAVTAGLFGIAIGAAAVLLARHEPPQPAADTAILLPPAPAEAPAATPPSGAVSPPQAAPAPAKTESDLPTVDLPARPIHTVPDALPPTPTVTLLDKKGRTIRELTPDPSEIATVVPAAGPARAPSTTPPATPRQLAVAPAGASFGGLGAALGPTTIAIDNRTVRLFGVKPAAPNERCGLGAGDSRSCAEVARDALTQRLRRYPKVYCRVPAGQHGEAGAICLDGNGTDLAGYLVGEGYVRADTAASRDYDGAESVARSLRRGLWHGR
jgi:endonuclease YncB( thermonuclease family)